VLVVEDGPTITHGGLPFGAGTVAARQGGASTFVDPRPYAVGSIADTFARYPGIGLVLPEMGYGEQQVRELTATITAAPCEVVVAGTPIDLGRLIGDVGKPVRRVTYELRDVGEHILGDVLAPLARSGPSSGHAPRDRQGSYAGAAAWRPHANGGGPQPITAIARPARPRRPSGDRGWRQRRSSRPE
jgi:hypothetical protein